MNDTTLERDMVQKYISINDMNSKINELHSVVSDLNKTVKKRYIRSIESVIDEWKACMKKMLDGIPYCVMDKNDITVEQAVNVIRMAMIKDDPSVKGSLAHAWHCNIANACFDSLNGTAQWRHKVSNAAASRSMRMLFDVETEA
jgi:hypothetical protein